MRYAVLALVALLAVGCGASKRSASGVLGAHVEHCSAGQRFPIGTTRIAYASLAPRGAVAFRRPGGKVRARFGPKNVNRYPTVFGVVGAVVRRDCTPTWYRVQLPIKPNGATGWVRASALHLESVNVRIVVDISDRRLTLFRNGKPELRATVAVGSPSTPTPTGRYYVNQRLVPTDKSGPFGPGAVGISAFSNVLTGWAQGGPIAIHGTNEPWSIGHAVSNGCIRLPNATLARIFREAIAGTPVIINA